MTTVVVGGGISGLVAAFDLSRAGRDVVCVEPSPRPGGLIRSEQREGFLCEWGPEAILDGAPETRALIEELALGPEVVRVQAEARKRLIYVRGRLRPLPRDPFSLVSSDLLTAAGKWRLLREPWVRPRPANDTDDESVLAFGERRLGPEAARNLVAPATIGVFAGDAARLSLKSAFPRLHALETRHGSLLRGLRAMRKEGGSPGRALSFTGGLERLPIALAARLGPRLIQAEVRGLRRAGSGWELDLAPGVAGGPTRLQAEAVVLATPARVSAALLAPLAPGAAAVLAEMPIAPAAIVFLGYRTRPPGVDLDAYGFLVARGEGPQLLGCQYEATIFPGRAPAGGALFRLIMGGTFDPGVTGESDESLIARGRADCRRSPGSRPRPTSWPRSASPRPSPSTSLATRAGSPRSSRRWPPSRACTSSGRPCTASGSTTASGTRSGSGAGCWRPSASPSPVAAPRLLEAAGVGRADRQLEEGEDLLGGAHHQQLALARRTGRRRRYRRLARLNPKEASTSGGLSCTVVRVLPSRRNTTTWPAPTDPLTAAAGAETTISIPGELP